MRHYDAKGVKPHVALPDVLVAVHGRSERRLAVVSVDCRQVGKPDLLVELLHHAVQPFLSCGVEQTSISANKSRFNESLAANFKASG